MKTFKTTIIIILLAALFFTIDYRFGRPAPMEIGIVTHKTFAKAEPGYYHVLVVLQTQKQRGYYITVPRDYFYDIDPGDRVPLRKKYGLVTGYEYEQAIVYNGEN